MTWIIHRPNIYDPSKDLPSYVGKCRTVREALIARFGSDQFDLPTFVTVNRIPTLRAHWDDLISDTTTIEVVTVPGDMSTAVLGALTVASLLLTAYSLWKASDLPSVATGVGATVPDTTPVFTFEGQKNIQRLNNPVDCVFGKVRWWPAYLCTPRIEYLNNKPIMYFWFSLGQGCFELEDVRVNDTSLTTITGAQYELFDDPHTMGFDDYDLVSYAEDFSNSELTGTNEDDHAIVGPYQLNPTNTTALVIKVNFRYPNGLYAVNTTGVLVETSVTTTVFITEIDNNGNETGKSESWNFTHTKATTVPQRITETISLTSWSGWIGTGRFKVSAVRTNEKNIATNGQDRCVVESAYSLGRSLKTFNVSVLKVVLPGTNATDPSSSEKINIVATRKLQLLQSGVFSTDKYATRNVVLAILEVLRKSAKVADSDLDLNYWENLIGLLSEYSFDYRFDSKSTVWEALQAMSACARAVPYYVGSDIRLSCDSPIKQPVLMITADNLSEFSLNIDFKTESDSDCIEVAYIDPDTGLQDSIFFTPPGSEAKSPTKITFVGCTDRQQAWRYGAYVYYKKALLRNRASVTLSQDGKIPLLGEVVILSMPLPSWTDAGILEDVSTVGSVSTVTTSEPIPYASGWIALRRSNGTCYGPIQFSATINGYEATLLSTLSEPFDFTGVTENYIAYTISQLSVATKVFEVESAVPSEDSVKLELVEFNSNVFAYDNLSVPDRGDDMLPYPSVTGAVPWLRVLEQSGQFLKVEHGPIYGEPTSIVCKYIYLETDNIDYPSLVSAPWGYLDDGIVYPMLEADLVGNSHYIEREDKDLFIKFVVNYSGTAFATWWRGRIGEYGTGANRPLHVLVSNNCDDTYVAPESSSNEASPNAQGVSALAGSGILGNAVFDVAEKKIEVQIDATPDTEINVKITCSKVDASITNSVTKVSKDGGLVVFTERDLSVAGCLDLETETVYPIVKVTAWREGAASDACECYLEIKPLVTTPVAQALKHTFVSNNIYAAREYYTWSDSVLHTFAGNLTRQYYVELLDNFVGFGQIKFESYVQDSSTHEPTLPKKTLVVKTNKILVDRFAYPHIDNITWGDIHGIGNHQVSLDGVLHTGSMLMSELSSESHWCSVFLDENLDFVMIRNSETDASYYVQNFRGGLPQPMPSSYVDSKDRFTVSFGAEAGAITTGELDTIRTIKTIVMINNPVAINPSIRSNGWGSVEATVLDMFGYAGNNTPVSWPTTP